MPHSLPWSHRGLRSHWGSTGVAEAIWGIESCSGVAKISSGAEGAPLEIVFQYHNPDAQPGVHTCFSCNHLGARLNLVIVVGHSPAIKFFPGMVEADPGVTIVRDKRIQAQQAFSTKRARMCICTVAVMCIVLFYLNVLDYLGCVSMWCISV